MQHPKTILRETLKKRRLAMSFEDMSVKSSLINEQLKLLDWTNKTHVHIYEPILRLNEVNIQTFSDCLLNNYPNVDLYTSRLMSGKWEIVSFVEDQVFSYISFNAVIVPMLGYDQYLNRLGYGKGYYDKLLANDENIYKIGVCYSDNELEHVPVEAHDIKMDIIITDTQVLTK